MPVYTWLFYSFLMLILPMAACYTVPLYLHATAEEVSLTPALKARQARWFRAGTGFAVSAGVLALLSLLAVALEAQ